MVLVLLVLLGLPAAYIFGLGSISDRPAAVFNFLVPALLYLVLARVLLPRTPRSMAGRIPEDDQPLTQSPDGSVILIPPGDRNPAAPPPSREAAGELVAMMTAYSLILLLGGICLGVAVLSPNLALALLAAIALWVVLWAPEGARRTVLTSTVVINREPAAVFDFVSDSTNAPRYQYMYDLTVEKITPGPVHVGTQFRTHVNLRAGIDPATRNVSSDGVEEVLEFDPDRRLVSSVISGRRPNRDVMTFEEVPGGTRLTHRFEFVHSYPHALIGVRLRHRDMNRRLKANRIATWNRAKEILEGRQPVIP